MNELDELLEQLLCRAYTDIIYNEEKILKEMIGDKLSVKEFHTLDIVSKCEASGTNTAGNIAKLLGITISTCTINLDRLVAKGYLTKVKQDKDRRICFVNLTSAGNSIRQKHEIMHKKVVNNAIKNLSSSEKVALLSAINKIEI